MKRFHFCSAACVLALASCYYQPGPGYAAPYPPRPAYNPGYVGNQPNDGKVAHNQGFNLGVRDARQGRPPNYLRYNRLYTSSTQKDFGRGYMTGYRTIRPR